MADQLANDVKSLQINDSGGENTPRDIVKTYGFPLEETYKLALHFYKDKDGKGLFLSYKDKLKMVAYTKQAAHGKYRPDVSPDVGFLDVVGSDRKQAWLSLGDMSKETAMEEFVKLLDGLCPLFAPYLTAHKTEQEEKARMEQEEEEQRKREEEEKERKAQEEEAQKQMQLDKQRQIEQEMQIRVALNQQTAAQFRQYAEQQCPGNAKQQEELIGQLQEQHFQQYMQQVYQQQLLHQQQQYQQLQAMTAAKQAELTQATPTATPTATPAVQHQTLDVMANGPVPAPTAMPAASQNGEEGLAEKHEVEAPQLSASIMPASVWTHKDIVEFKVEMRNSENNVLTLGSLTTTTVRVPTHEDGACLFWEFATDYYDIGFGVYFEWTIAPSNTVSVHVSESSDEEELDEEAEGGKPADIEKGDKNDDRPPMDEIIPVYRRDCHEEVYCGSHAYPGRGVYLLKFDNSYSLWRSKTLYYRVYYSR